MSDDDEAVFVDFVNRARRAQAAVDEVIRSSSEPEPEVGIRERFEHDTYWVLRSQIERVLDAGTDEEYRIQLATLKQAVEDAPT